MATQKEIIRNLLLYDINHLRRGLTDFFGSKDNEFYERGIDLLPEKWQKSVEADGAYFE